MTQDKGTLETPMDTCAYCDEPTPPEKFTDPEFDGCADCIAILYPDLSTSTNNRRD